MLRYGLDAADPRRAALHLRATGALDAGGERDVAAGISVRPLRDVPVVLAGEVRAVDGPFGRDVRPAAFVVAAPPPTRLGAGFDLSAYAQGGYVAGRAETAFVDGQARIARNVAAGGTARLDAGAGVWGGAQRGASRLDIGPSAALTAAVGEVPVRLQVDYRIRVAGDARPASGPAVTLAAGF